MAAETVVPGSAGSGARPAGRFPGAVVAVHTARRSLRSAVIWGCVFGVYVVASALGYADTYHTAAQRRELATTFGANVGVNAIIGPAHQIDTVAGFTAWRTVGVLSLVGAVVGLLTATRLLRGEEEAGRWEVLLVGQTTRGRAVAQGIAGLGAGLLALWTVTAVSSVAVGRATQVGFSVGAALFLAVALASSAAMFLAVGALASQLAPTRRQAAGYSAAFLGACYALRMVADSGSELSWLRWVSPLGWVEEMQPLTSPRVLPLLLVAALLAVLVTLAVRLAGSRDLGASVVPDRVTSGGRMRLMTGPTGLAFRLTRPTVTGWLAGIAVAGLMMGLIAKSAGKVLAESPTFTSAFPQLRSRGAGAYAYLGLTFIVMASLVTLVAVGQLGAARDEEALGRLDNLLVRPVSRTAWLGSRLLLTLLYLVALGITAGVSSWVGAAAQDSGVGLGSMLEAGVNVVPSSVFVLGVGVLALGLRPRAASAITYSLLAWGFLVEFVGGLIKANHWILDTSVFHHVAAAPAVDPDWTANAILVLLGLAGAAGGAFALAHRDLAGE